MPTPPRPVDYTLTPADAARLRGSRWRRLVAAIGSSRDGVQPTAGGRPHARSGWSGSCSRPCRRSSSRRARRPAARHRTRVAEASQPVIKAAPGAITDTAGNCGCRCRPDVRRCRRPVRASGPGSLERGPGPRRGYSAGSGDVRCAGGLDPARDERDRHGRGDRSHGRRAHGCRVDRRPDRPRAGVGRRPAPRGLGGRSSWSDSACSSSAGARAGSTTADPSTAPPGAPRVHLIRAQ